tara:strand:- start:1881 stop:2666 length:786 start_codon:yes stop_codon:yes gene_type:complete
MNEYFEQAAQRYATRIRAQKTDKSMGVQKILDINSLMAIYDEFVILLKYFRGTPDKFVNGKLIKGTPGAWQGIWDKAGSSSLRKILRIAKVPIPSDLVWGQQEFADYAMENAVAKITDTTGKQIGQRVQDGLLNGESLDDIASQITKYAPTDKTFGQGRAMTIARTESTNAISTAQLRSYETAKVDFGVKIKKAWIATKDEHLRDLHYKLERKYGDANQAIDTTEQFKIAGYAGMGPGLFGDAGMDINCRCAILPVVETDD